MIHPLRRAISRDGSRYLTVRGPAGSPRSMTRLSIMGVCCALPRRDRPAKGSPRRRDRRPDARTPIPSGSAARQASAGTGDLRTGPVSVDGHRVCLRELSMTIRTASPLPRDGSATELRDRLVAGVFSAEEITAACLARIDAREPEIGAWAWIDAERALGEARRLDADW